MELYFEVTLLLCYKISSNRETPKQWPRKASNFSCFPHRNLVALKLRIVFTKRESISKLERNKCTTWLSYGRFSRFGQ